MQEIVINRCFGGFGLSQQAVEWMRENGYEAGERCKLSGEKLEDGSGTVSEIVKTTNPRGEAFRTAPGLVAAVKELGDGANGTHADLKVVVSTAGLSPRTIAGCSTFTQLYTTTSSPSLITLNLSPIIGNHHRRRQSRSRPRARSRRRSRCRG